jgi:hypothetical protein
MIDAVDGMIDRRRPVAGPSGALRASKFTAGEFVAALAKTGKVIEVLTCCYNSRAFM